MSKKRWNIAFVPFGDGEYDVTVRRSGAVHRFRTRLPPDISDLWEASDQTAGTTRSFRSNAAELTPEARFFQAGNLPTLKDIGERVLESVFDLNNSAEGPKILGALEDRIADNDGVEIEIDLSQASELSGVPWEALYLKSHDRFLAIGTTSNIVRKLDAQSELPPPASKPIRILVAAANPWRDLETDVELGNISKRIDNLVAAKDGEFEIRSLPAVNREDFRQTLSEWQPHVIHYIGHSGFKDGAGYLAFETGEEGVGDKLSAETLRNMLLNYRPWLVVLNSCQSGQTSADEPMAGVAQNLLQRLNVPFVVGMQQPVSDDAAINFSQEFYTALIRGETIASAVTLGRCAIASDDDERTQVELITPALYTSGETDRIAFVESQAAPAVAGAGEAEAQEGGLLKRKGIQRGLIGASIVGIIGTVSATSDDLLNIFRNFNEAREIASGASNGSEPTANGANNPVAQAAEPVDEAADSLAEETPQVTTPVNQSPREVLANVAPRNRDVPPEIQRPVSASPPPAPPPPRTAGTLIGEGVIGGGILAGPRIVSQEPATRDGVNGFILTYEDGTSRFFSDQGAVVIGGDNDAPTRVASRSYTYSAGDPSQAYPAGGGGGYAGQPQIIGGGGGFASQPYTVGGVTTTNTKYYVSDAAREADTAVPEPAYTPVTDELPAPVPCAKVLFETNFGFDETAVPDAARSAYTEARQLSDDCAGISAVTFVGYTDTAGASDYNERLSLERARSVADDFQVHSGGYLGPVQLVGMGESAPLIPTADGMVEEANRRVEVILEPYCYDYPADLSITDASAVGALEGYEYQGQGPVTISHSVSQEGSTLDLQEFSRDLADNLGIPYGSIATYDLGDKCLAPGETSRIDIDGIIPKAER
ncbi:CHAT domain-containing protein [Qipengyuania psychrotolerans]|uniref:CHAT domain-containing protein n=1 Tax=Qipengyuania psychrotolerans TaxID=2867238 RepID=A0ABX8ZEW3_9SPHN|nr:CHAT domain-containing protein [Qipengyuania psychrotolerans]QZD87557.1 CHAT domain-containing protein [Qipengyuania psychrotolerans]